MEKVKIRFKQEQSFDNRYFEESIIFDSYGYFSYIKNESYKLDFDFEDNNDLLQIKIDYDLQTNEITIHEVSNTKKLYLLLPLNNQGEGYIKTLDGVLLFTTFLEHVEIDESSKKDNIIIKYDLEQNNSQKIYQKLLLEIEKN